MEIDLGEVLRYIGAHGSDAAVIKRAEEISAEILPALNPRKIAARFSITETAGGFLLDGTDVVFKGRLVEKTLSGCGGIFLFAATLGLESERLLKNYFALDFLSGSICDGVLTAAIESFCDGIEEAVRQAAAAEGKSAVKRISCGYGDFDLRNQSGILRLLKAEKILGIKLNGNFMMYPNKSVTAVVGIKDEN